MTALDGRARLVGLARPSLETIPDGVFRDMMFERLEALAQHRLEDRAKGAVKRPLPKPGTGKPAQQRTPMRVALAHLVQDPSLAEHAPDMSVFEGCDLPGIEILQELVDFCAKSPNMTTAQVLELWHDHPAQSYLDTMATWQFPGDQEQLAQEFRDAVARLELQWMENRKGRLPKIVEQTPEQKEEYRMLDKRIAELKTRSGNAES